MLIVCGFYFERPHTMAMERRRFMELDEMRNVLLDIGVSEQTIKCVCYINGYSEESLSDILFVHTGNRTFEQLLEE